MIWQTGIAGLLALLMVLPAEHLFAAHCPMEMESRKQQTADSCCPVTGESRHGQNHQDEQSGHGEQNEQGEQCRHTGNQLASHCVDCICVLVPASDVGDLYASEATYQQIFADVPAPQRDHSYTVEETIEAPAPSGKPIHRPVPIYLSNQVFLN